MNRNKILAIADTLARNEEPPLQPDDLLTTIHTTPPPHTATDHHINAIETTLTHLTRLETTHGGTITRNLGLTALTDATHLLDTPMPNSHLHRLSSLTAALAARVAHATFDIGGDDAPELYTLALHIAQTADDPDTRAQIGTDLAYWYIDKGLHHRALRITHHITTTTPGITPAGRLQLAGATARAHAYTGNQPATLTTLAHLDTHAQHIPTDRRKLSPSLRNLLDYGYIDSLKGQALYALTTRTPGNPHLDTALHHLIAACENLTIAQRHRAVTHCAVRAALLTHHTNDTTATQENAQLARYSLQHLHSPRALHEVRHLIDTIGH